MTWFGWTWIALIGLSTILNVKDVGKPRKPMSGTTAAILVCITAAQIGGILFIGTGHLL